MSAPAAQLSRPALLYCLAALAAAAGLLAGDLPVGLSLLGAGCIVWRLLIHRGRLAFPGRAVKALLVAASCAGIAAAYRSGLSLDVYVALLMAGLSLKSLELYHTASAQRFLYIALLALMAFLLYRQDFAATLLALLQVHLIVAALAAVHADPHQLARQPLAPLRTAATTLGLALPLLVFLFVVMPRLPPLWSLPLHKPEARIGMGEDMSPGDFSRPARSAELAFRAGFPGGIPPAATLYWRGTVLDTFDGRRWSNACDCHYRWANTGTPPRPAGTPAYSIVLEPHEHRWIFTLDRARLADDRIAGNGEHLFRYRQALFERISYDVWTEPGAPPPMLTPAERERYLRLPVRGNARALALGRSWRRDGASADAIVEQALRLYHQSFVYTLEPPLLGDDSVDGFLFETRRGFCEHFAGAFVFLMRAAGIPARVVMGYQGGQRNLQERYVTVRQYDAHAWAEIWRDDSGWWRVDPTAVVAPERVERGFAELFPDSPAFATLLGRRVSGRQSLLGLLRIKLDHLDYLVGRWILGYDNDRRQSLLQRLRLDTVWGLLSVFTGGLGLTLAGFLLWLRRRDRERPRTDPLTIRYRRLCQLYGTLGWPRAPTETPMGFARRMGAAGAPEAAGFGELSARYAGWLYAGAPDEGERKALLRTMRQLLARLRRRAIAHRMKRWLAGE